MDQLVLSPTMRLRRTPFWDGVEAAGVMACSVYNHMLLPSIFVSLEEDYFHLKQHVQLWDVSCQRQLRLRGRDAAQLAQMMTPRSIGTMKVGQCFYAPAVDRDGFLLNDPVLLKLDQDEFWFSLSDSDLLLYASGLAAGAGLEVEIDEPDVSPLAVQGPKAEMLMERVFGPAVSSLGFFRFGLFECMGVSHVVSRSGYSKQGGFEIYVHGCNNAMPLWRLLLEAGSDLEARPGCPNYPERIEAGLLSYGSDITREHTPFEAGLAQYCNLDRCGGFAGRDALARMEAEGARRKIRSLSIDGPAVPQCDRPWPVACNGRAAGQVTSAAWSPGFSQNVAIGMIEAKCWHAGTGLTVEIAGDTRMATVRSGFYT